MRILYIHQFFATRDSSHPTRSYEFARRMVARGHTVTMLTGTSRLGPEFAKGLSTRRSVDGIDVQAIRNDYSNYMGYMRRMWSFGLFMAASTLSALRGPRPDVIFATSTPLTVAIPGLIASKLRRVPLVFEVRDPWPDAAFQMGALSPTSAVGRLARWLERKTYRDSTAIVGLSPGMVDFIRGEGADPEKIHMIPNCSDLELFHPGPKDEGIVSRFHLNDRFVVGYAGAIGPANAIHVIADAAALLKARGRKDIVILLAGDGRQLPTIREDKEMRDLDNLLLLGSVAKHDMPALLRTCDALLVHLAAVPVLYTGSPNKLFDGLATGRPIIVNSPGWTRPLVVDNDAGIYVDPEDASQLADAIQRLADSPEDCERMGRNARALAERDFARDDQADRLIEVLAHAAR